MENSTTRTDEMRDHLLMENKRDIVDIRLRVVRIEEILEDHTVQIAALVDGQKRLERRFDGLEQRFDGLEQKVDSGFRAIMEHLGIAAPAAN